MITLYFKKCFQSQNLGGWEYDVSVFKIILLITCTGKKKGFSYTNTENTTCNNRPTFAAAENLVMIVLPQNSFSVGLPVGSFCSRQHAGKKLSKSSPSCFLQIKQTICWPAAVCSVLYVDSHLCREEFTLKTNLQSKSQLEP